MIKTTVKIVAGVLLAFGALYAALVVPNDRRLAPVDTAPGAVAGDPQRKVYDFIDRLPEAAVSSPSLGEAKKLLAGYAYVQSHPAQHTHPQNLHVSLGWYPMKTVHENAIFAPAPSSIAYRLRLPRKPVIKFDYGIISSIKGRLQEPVGFSIAVDVDGKSEQVFADTVEPMKPYRWRYYDSWYKNVYKYLHPRLEDREGRWLAGMADLSKYAGRDVTLVLRTASSGGTGLGFWGSPALYDDASADGSVSRVILVVVDSLRADHVRPEIAPELSALAAGALRFTGALSNGNMTKLSVPSFLTSRHAFEIPEVTRHYDMSPEEKDTFYRRRIPTLASTLRQEGFRTAAIGSLSLFTDGHGFSVDLGFDEAENLEHSGYSPPHTTAAGIEWLKRHGREKFFLMLYYEGPHGPYRPPLRFLWRALKHRFLYANTYDLLYAGEVAYHDAYIGELKNFLAANGFDRDTAVIVTADHGVAFRSVEYNWPGRAGAPWKKKRFRFHSHGVSVTPDDLNVPFIVAADGLKGALAAKVQLLDLAPTILDLVGVTPPRDFRGRSVLPLARKEAFSEPVTYHQGWTNRGIYTDDGWLYIQNIEPREGFPPQTVVPEEVFNYKNDRFCRNNLAGNPAPPLARLRAAMYGITPRDKEVLCLKYLGTGTLRLGIAGAQTFSISRGSGTVETVRGPAAIEFRPDEEISVSCEPADAVLTLKPSVNGMPLVLGDVLAGRNALPLWESFTLSPVQRFHSLGWPARVPAVSGNKLLAGIVERSAAGKENLTRSPQQLKSMLEEWGYIN